MDTVILQGNSSEDLHKAAALLRAGEAVAFPTDTVYGLGANAKEDVAIQKIYTAKGRPSDKPLILLIHDKRQLLQFTENISDTAQKLMDAFWPGSLTLIFPLRDNTVSAAVTRGKTTVGVRMPNHPIALELLTLADVPIAAPSANLSGKPSPVTAEQVAADLDGRIAAIVSGGTCSIGMASTIVDVSSDLPIILRQGAISREQLEAVLGIPIKAVND
ncbi:MAG: threonylcarbamoyl-AMP synthase [Peptococcaceae bacterium]|nr:threonylcarbamoyl-AMP synthase [Peptococcaceae bacterium]